MEPSTDTLTIGGALVAGAFALWRLLIADAPLTRSVKHLEEQLAASRQERRELQAENTQLRADVDAEQDGRRAAEQDAWRWRHRALDAGWIPTEHDDGNGHATD